MGPFEVGGGGLVDGGDRLAEEVVPAEAGVAFAAIRVQDPERRPTTRRSVSVARDEGLRALTDDIAAETDPRTPRQFQAQTARLRDGTGHRPAQTGRLEDDEERLRTTGERGETAQPVRDDARPIRGGETAAGEIQHQQVHRPAGQQRAGDREALVEGGRGDDHEPLKTDAACHGLDRVEGTGEIQPRDDAARDLGLGDHAQGERGPATGAIAADRDARGAGQATGTQDGIQAGEPGMDDPFVGGDALTDDDVRLPGRCQFLGPWRRRGGQCQRSDHLRSCRTPSSLEARQGRRHVRGKGRHVSSG